MAVIPKEHEALYFDKLIRTKKKDVVQALIKATYFADKNVNNKKEEIAKRLEHAYNLYRNSSGSYSGSVSQFDSQYTIGHEMAIWKNSDLELTKLAIDVAEDKMTICDYFDIVFLNYIQPVKGKIVHPVYKILTFMKQNNVDNIDKNELGIILDVWVGTEEQNSLCNFLNDTNYFSFIKDTLYFNSNNYEIDDLINKCNKKYLNEDGYEKALNELNNPDEYDKYIHFSSLLEDNDEFNYLYELKNKDFAFETFNIIKNHLDSEVLEILTSNVLSNQYTKHLRAVLIDITDKVENDEDYFVGDICNRYYREFVEAKNHKYIISNDWYYRTHNNYDNKTPYINFIKFVINKPLKVSAIDEIYENEENKNEIFKKYYFDNIGKELEFAKEGIKLREEFVQEYPLSRIKEMTLEEYALGNSNFKETLSYKIEFGKYMHVGMGIRGSGSSKHGIYWSSNSDLIFQKDIIEKENYESLWNEFRNQLYSFLVEYKNIDYPIAINDKYPMLKGMYMVLTKLLFLYYPEKFLPIASKPKLIEVFDYFEYDFDANLKAEALNFILYKEINKNFEFVVDTDSQIVGNILWNFISNVIESEDLDNEVIEEVPTLVEKYDKKKFLEEVYIDEEKYDAIVNVLERKKNIILEGAPGVGKTFMAKRLAYSMIGEKDKSKIEMIQFHQSYAYEDFVEGYRPNENGFNLERGILYNFCNKAKNDRLNKYYLIIDEINRGNLSRIFGELLMLIENDKRDEKLTLVYSKEEFFIPSNLYIIGLMNTADRSLAIIDYALRRRFSFIKVEPAYNNNSFINYLNNKLDSSLKDIISVMNDLNNEIETDNSLGDGFKIGHSYFCNLKDGSKEEIKNIIKYEIIPLIEEYWYDDKEKLDKWRNTLYGRCNN